jgi:hypothetical protein
MTRLASDLISTAIGRPIRYLYHFTKLGDLNFAIKKIYKVPMSPSLLPVHFSMKHQISRIYDEKFRFINLQLEKTIGEYSPDKIVMFRVPANDLDPDCVSFVPNKDMNDELFVRYHDQFIFENDYPVWFLDANSDFIEENEVKK